MELREGQILCLGNPLLDISATTDFDFLKKYDLKPNDAILANEKHKTLYDELIQKYKAEYIAGGSGQNTLRVAQWFMEKPNVGVFFGCVGEDKFSKILEEKARNDGVNVRYQYTKEQPTGTCAVLITDNHRSLCANLAAANLFSVEHIRTPENRKIIAEAEYFYIAGFFLSVSPLSIMEIAKHALNYNRTFMMNLSAPFLALCFKEPLMEAIPYVDILFGNEAEAETFAEVQGWNTTDLKKIGRQIATLPKLNKLRSRLVIITQGHGPVLVFQEDKLVEHPVVELDKSKIVDTNGAGDAFVGGFLAQYIQKKHLDVCVRCGVWAAQEIIQRSGCTFEGTPGFKE